MRPLIVVAIDEVIELGLLLQEVFSRRLGGLELQGQMHTLMPAVLLRMAGLDPLDLDAEPEPPDRQPAQSEQRIGTGKGNAVVGANGPRQAKFLEGTLTHRECISFLW